MASLAHTKPLLQIILIFCKSHCDKFVLWLVNPGDSISTSVNENLCTQFRHALHHTANQMYASQSSLWYAYIDPSVWSHAIHFDWWMGELGKIDSFEWSMWHAKFALPPWGLLTLYVMDYSGMKFSLVRYWEYSIQFPPTTFILHCVSKASVI